MNEKSNNALYENQSFIRKHTDSLYSLMYNVSSKTVINPIITCLLFFVEDIQLLYFAYFDNSVISMNENIRSKIKMMGFDDNYIIFYYCQLAFNVLFLAGVAIILFYVFFISIEKYKENRCFKYLRLIFILYNTILFPLYSHIFAKALISKNGKLAAFPYIDYTQGQMALFVIGVLSFIFFIIGQLLVLPYVFINPTPFNKGNSLCQTYGYLGQKYNIFVIILCFLTVVMKNYIGYSKLIPILMFLFILYSLSELLNAQPYFNKHVNHFRSGMWTMILGISIVDLFSMLYGNGRSFFSIISFVIGIISFFIGIFLSRYRYNKHIREIYMRFKAKKLEDKNVNNNGEVSLSIESHESSNPDNEEKSNSEKSYSESNDDDDDNDEEEDDDEKDSSENSDEDDDNVDTSDNDDNSAFVSDRISEKITSFSRIKDIVNDRIMNEPVIVFSKLNDFELSCRFIWNNETREAFNLMKEFYIERLSKEDMNMIIGIKKDGYEDEEDINNNNSDYDGSDNNSSNNSDDYDDSDKKKGSANENKKNSEAMDDDQITNKPDYLLKKALNYKINYLQKYFIKFLIFDIKDKKKEDTDYYKNEYFEYMSRLQHEAIEKHITLLNLMKGFFNNIIFLNSNRGVGNNDTFDIDKFLILSCNLKDETSKLYQKIIAQFPDEKSSYQLYTLFMTEVMNQTEGDDSIGALNNKIAKQKSKMGSLMSLGVSNAGGSTYGGDLEGRRRKIYKKNMIQALTNKYKRYSKLTLGTFFLISILYIISIVYGFIHINSYNTSVNNIQVLSEMNYIVHNILSRTRMLTSSMALGEMNVLQENLPVLEGYIDIIESQYIPILKKYAFNPPSDNPIILYDPNNGGDTKSEYVNLNGYELVKNIIVWSRELFSVSLEEWLNRVEKGENILLDYRFRMFAENFKYYYYDVMEESVNILYKDEITSKNEKVMILYILTGFFVALSLIINFLGLTPLYYNTKHIYDKTMGMFRYLLKGSVKDIVAKFDNSIESITDIFDNSFDTKKAKYNVDKNAFSFYYIKFKGYLVNILLICSILCLTKPIITKDKEIVNSVNYNMYAGKRKEMVLFLSIFAYEVLIHDEYVYAPGTAETYLNYEIEKLEKLQNELYSGTMGALSTAKMRYLDSINIVNGCKLDQEICDTIDEYYDYDFTKGLVKTGLNNIIEEFLNKMKIIAYKSRIKDIKNEQYMYNNDHNYILKAINAYTCPEFLFELNVMQHIIGGLEKFDKIVYDKIYESIKAASSNLVLTTLLGILLITISSFITYRSVIDANKKIIELINVIFIVPQSTVNMIPQFKRFIETSSFEEE
ncbi:hypothetical protein BCR36DRAFT_405014 [Piromyces finnis]|uniref:Uncharacterized protein n=1 Tax=Piromyces finnis TaxID=1754191 RepID=A0A1Y1V6E4_9FUNG|nr:hypothetical protein BCR36DRAFT_405014 [Piromyces finnis]|eukprot:ORX48390.1 hypothetical protein BCR36DRAFT_405014 [Piromyces finnis]